MSTLKKIALGAFCSLFITNLIAQIECGTEANQQDNSHYRHIVNQFKNNNEDRSNLSIQDIPVYFHIVRRGDGTGGAYLPDLDAELEIVNDYFFGAQFHFFRCETPNYIDDDYFFNAIEKGTQDIPNIVSAHAVSGTINIFFAPEILGSTGNSICGFARFPWDEGNYIFMDNSCATNSSTLAHEFGHYFGLYHTHHFGGGVDYENINRNPDSECHNCETAGDLLCDTEADPRLSSTLVNSECDYIGNEKQVCMMVAPAELFAYEPSPINIMSYSIKECRSQFSAGQNGLMFNVYESIRKDQLNPYQCSLLPCQAEIILSLPENEIVTAPKVIHAGNKLVSTEKIEVSEKPGVIYKAGNSICLMPGFSTGPQTLFEASIEDCDKTVTGSKEEENLPKPVSLSNHTFVKENKVIGLNVMPNPFQNKVTLSFELKNSANAKLFVFDALGKVVLQKVMLQDLEAGYNETLMNTESWNAGVYFLEMRVGEERIIRKIVKL